MIRMTPMTRTTWDMADGREALELIKQPVPHSAPERNLLTLRSTAMIRDISQGIDSTVPTLSTKARRELTVSEMAKLMGHDLCETDLRFTSKEQMRQMLGLSMHVATAGFAITGLIAAVGGDS